MLTFSYHPILAYMPQGPKMAAFYKFSPINAAKDRPKRKRMMIMGASEHSPFGFFLCALALALLLPAQALDQSGNKFIQLLPIYIHRET